MVRVDISDLTLSRVNADDHPKCHALTVVEGELKRFGGVFVFETMFRFQKSIGSIEGGVGGTSVHPEQLHSFGCAGALCFEDHSVGLREANGGGGKTCLLYTSEAAGEGLGGDLGGGRVN